MSVSLATAVRVSVIAPGMTNTNFASTMTDPNVKAQLEERRQTWSLPADVIAAAIAYAISAPQDVDVSQIVVRPVGLRARTIGSLPTGRPAP